jgi:hypothetical protein
MGKASRRDFCSLYNRQPFKAGQSLQQGFSTNKNNPDQAFHLHDMFKGEIEAAVMRFNATSIA